MVSYLSFFHDFYGSHATTFTYGHPEILRFPNRDKEVIATESIGNRIKNLRKALGLTQKDFGSRIGVKPNTIATYEIDRNAPIDAVLSLICREFGVNEVWLRTGVGEMFRPISREEEIAAFVGDVLHDEPGSFRKGLVSALAALTTEDWKVLEKLSIEAIERARKSSECDCQERPK